MTYDGVHRFGLAFRGRYNLKGMEVGETCLVSVPEDVSQSTIRHRIATAAYYAFGKGNASVRTTKRGILVTRIE